MACPRFCCVWFGLHRAQASGSNGAVTTWATTSVWPISYWDPATGGLTLCGPPRGGDGGGGGPSVGGAECYVRSFYLATATLSTVGFGDLYPTSAVETVWQLVVVLVGCSLVAALVGAWQAILRQVQHHSTYKLTN